jgi:hypothetical protein
MNNLYITWQFFLTDAKRIPQPGGFNQYISDFGIEIKKSEKSFII